MKQGGIGLRLRWRAGLVWGYLAAAAMGWSAGGVQAQQKGTAAIERSPANIIVEIDDPNLGIRWLLRRDPAHPGGPGIVETATCADMNLAVEAEPVMRRGDRVMVEESSKFVEARLEAIALGSATQGKTFQARLKIGGKVVRAIAVAAGRATLMPEAPR